jgi:hypothetical protein
MIVYSGFTSKLGKDISNPERHIKQFCSREPVQRFTNVRNMVSWFVRTTVMFVTVVVLDYEWECETGHITSVKTGLIGFECGGVEMGTGSNFQAHTGTIHNILLSEAFL